MKKRMKIEDIRKAGLEALDKTLGPDGMIRFLNEFSYGSGNYSKDRHKYLDTYDVDAIYEEIKKK